MYSNFTLKLIPTKYDKTCVCEEIHARNILSKRNILELNDLGFLCYSKTPCPDLAGEI